MSQQTFLRLISGSGAQAVPSHLFNRRPLISHPERQTARKQKRGKAEPEDQESPPSWKDWSFLFPAGRFRLLHQPDSIRKMNKPPLEGGGRGFKTAPKGRGGGSGGAAGRSTLGGRLIPSLNTCWPQREAGSSGESCRFPSSPRRENGFEEICSHVSPPLDLFRPFSPSVRLGLMDP